MACKRDSGQALAPFSPAQQIPALHKLAPALPAAASPALKVRAWRPRHGLAPQTHA